MSKQRIVIVGGGFAGVWAAMGAAATVRRASAADRVSISLVSPDDALVIKPRLYERDLAGVRVPLAGVLEPLGVRHHRATVAAIDVSQKVLGVEDNDELAYDQLVLCAGSQTALPDAAEGVHGVSSFEQARALRDAIDALRQSPGAGFTATVVGAGFTGIELACELAGVLREAAGRAGAAPPQVPVCLIDRAPTVAPEFGPRAREVIESALDGLGVARRCGTAVAGAGAAAVTMQGGARVQADLTIWAVGPRAHPLYGRLGLPVDASGRVLADEHLATSADGVWVAGDGARVAVDGAHDAPMSCQHAIPQGRLAGANAVARALGASIGSYRQPLYLTCLDLGAAGALVTEGFERNRILATGAQAKAFNNYINRCGIYPPAGARALYRAGRARPAGRFGAALQRRLLASAAVRRAVIAGGTDRAADHGAAAAL